MPSVQAPQRLIFSSSSTFRRVHPFPNLLHATQFVQLACIRPKTDTMKLTNMLSNEYSSTETSMCAESSSQGSTTTFSSIDSLPIMIEVPDCESSRGRLGHLADFEDNHFTPNANAQLKRHSCPAVVFSGLTYSNSVQRLPRAGASRQGRRKNAVIP